MSDREMVEVNDIKFSVEIQILEVDNVKANLHGLILLMIMVKNNASLEINIEKSLISIILGYLEEDRISPNKKFTSGDDNALRSYKIKNLLKILPTYAVLFERNCGHILTDICIRCELVVEDWEHTLCSSKQERQLLEEIWENRYLNRSGIWLQRCNKKVNEIENRKGVTKGDKKRKRIISEIDEIEDVGLYS
ncbi:hypothetical protein GLOIN_2v1780353 [Rhizophagus irregularis DAOM 181602=DAOM 197198]|nr:hypothetical protein GLOIN_2v1780353 [Rhizophagus irregularis DAOM 181602=DAOM 197198]